MRIAEFLLARLGRDEIEIRTARHSDEVFIPFGTLRLLADVQAKRAIVARHSVVEVVRHEDHAGADDILFCSHCGTDLDEGECPDLLDLATVYADHPDYEGAWRNPVGAGQHAGNSRPV